MSALGKLMDTLVAGMIPAVGELAAEIASENAAEAAEVVESLMVAVDDFHAGQLGFEELFIFAAESGVGDVDLVLAAHAEL